MVAGLKREVRKVEHRLSKEKAPHNLFLPVKRSNNSKRCARPLVMCAPCLKCIVETSRARVPPVSFVAEVVCEIDDFFENKLSGADTGEAAAGYGMMQAINGCGQYGYLRKLTRNSRTSRNKVLRELKALVH